MKSFDMEVQSKIKETLMNYKKLIKLYLKNNLFFLITWKKMTLKERVNFARALVYMESVAKNQKKYLSKEETDNEWLTRVKQFVEKGVPVEEAYDIAPCPCDIVHEKCKNVLQLTPYHSDYYDFLVAVHNYEYSNNFKQKSFEARHIIDEAKRVKKLLIQKKEDRWFLALKKMKGFDDVQK